MSTTIRALVAGLALFTAPHLVGFAQGALVSLVPDAFGDNPAAILENARTARRLLLAALAIAFYAGLFWPMRSLPQRLGALAIAFGSWWLASTLLDVLVFAAPWTHALSLFALVHLAIALVTLAAIQVIRRSGPQDQHAAPGTLRGP